MNILRNFNNSQNIIFIIYKLSENCNMTSNTILNCWNVIGDNKNKGACTTIFETKIKELQKCFNDNWKKTTDNNNIYNVPGGRKSRK